MKLGIENFCCSQNNNTLQWKYNGEPMHKVFDCNIYAECFKDQAAILVVKLSKQYAPNNALLLNADGTEKMIIENPVEHHQMPIFSDVYYEGDDLILTSRTNISQYKCIITSDGNISHVSESR